MVASLAKQDYYEILGVNKDASGDEIKKSYRNLARKYHPDANPDDPGAEAKFKALSEAYAVLSDSEKKAKYDQFGHAGADGQGFGDFDAGAAGFGDLNDVFDMFFGGGGGGRRRGGPQKGADLRLDMQLSFKEAVFGVERDVQVPRTETCQTCSGSGAAPGTSPQKCQVCRGVGQVQATVNTPFGRIQQSRTCSNCNGSGKIVKKPCATCQGNGQVRRTRNINVKIPAGVDHGTRVRLTGEGELGSKGGPPGDLYVFVFVRDHKIFKREGNDLFCEVPISFVQAALGDEITVPTLEGEAVMKVPAGTQAGSVFRLRDKGVPYISSSRRGDQHVRVKIKTPVKLNNNQKELLRKFAELSGEKVPKGSEKGFLNKVKDAFTG